MVFYGNSFFLRSLFSAMSGVCGVQLLETYEKFPDQLMLQVTDMLMRNPPIIKIYDMEADIQDQLDVPIMEIVCDDFKEKIHKAKWGFMNETIISINGEGKIHEVKSLCSS